VKNSFRFEESFPLLCSKLSEEPLLTGSVKLSPCVMPRLVASKYNGTKERDGEITEENERNPNYDRLVGYCVIQTASVV
jgi:hypothetical protein